MKAYCGIDYSMQSPAACVNIGDEYYYYGMIGVKKHQTTFKIGKSHFKIDDMPKKETFKNDIEKYSYISLKFLEFIRKVVCEKETDVLIEGYSMGSSKGLFLNIAENCQTLKIRLYNEPKLNLKFPSVPPNTLKLFATGHGHSDKKIMYQHWCEKTGIKTLSDHLTSNIEKSPISDLVDSFWVMCYLKENGKMK